MFSTICYWQVLGISMNRIQNPAISLLPHILRTIQEVPENAFYNQLSMIFHDFSYIFRFFPPILKPLHLKLSSHYSFYEYMSLKKKLFLEHFQITYIFRLTVGFSLFTRQ